MVVQYQVEAGVRLQAVVVAGEHAAELVVPCKQASGQVVPDRPVERAVDNVVVVLNKQAVQAQEVVAAPVDVELPVVPAASALKLPEQVPVVEPLVERVVEQVVERVVEQVVELFAELFAELLVAGVVVVAVVAVVVVAVADDTGVARPVTARTASVVVAFDMQRHFAVAVNNYHFVPADMPFAADDWLKFETAHMPSAADGWRTFAIDHTLFVEHKPLAELGLLAFEAAALEAQQLQQEPEPLVASRLAVVGQPQQQQEWELELQDARSFDAIEPGCWP